MSPLVLHAPDGARAAIEPQGAHVVSWVPASGGGERLFVSATAERRPGAAIRGGIPVIFPQFAALGPLPKHGFARTAPWNVAAYGAGAATLRLVDSGESRELWPHRFVAELTASVVGDRLAVALAVTNAGHEPFAFTAALHGYLRVADVEAIEIEGLAGLRYRDTAAGGAERVEGSAPLRIAGEVDRIYLDVPGPVVLREGTRRLVAVASGFPDVVVWNPGERLADSLRDLEPGGWRRFVCMEAAAIGRPVALEAGERWEGRQVLESRD